MASAFKTACCRRFSEKWHSLRSGSELPLLRDFLDTPDPVLQPHVILLDAVDEETFRVRLFATRLTEFVGVNLTGTNLYEFFREPRLVKQVQSAVRAVIGQPCGILSTKRAVTSSGANLAVEMLSLPMRPSANGAPVIAAAIDIIERLEPKDNIFGLVQYLSAEWVDIGSGVPKTPLLPH
jgi:hypothetical protein